MILKIQNLREKYNPTLFDAVLGIVCALFFSSFLYLEHFGITLKFLNTLFGLLALAMMLYIPKRAVLIAGFFIGLLWFYWIGYSFKYNGVGFMEPIITAVFGIVYMLFFGVLALSKSVAIRAFLLFLLTFFEPVDFNWMQLELLFVDSYFGIQKYHFIVILAALALPNYIANFAILEKQVFRSFRGLEGTLVPPVKTDLFVLMRNISQKPYFLAPLLLLLAALNYTPLEQKVSPLKIKLVSTDVKQDQKWTKEMLRPTLELIYKEIQNAKDEGYEVVVFPEAVFPFYMNQATSVIERLLELSHGITIVAGSLLKEENLHYNVTYMFEEGNYQIAKKMILVPFGEYIPLPEFAKEFINEIFFAGASDFKTADKPTDFTIKGVKFRNAICYEATCKEIYEGDVDFVIASSNNAWFYPSIEPTLQKLLMRFYARKNGTTIYHAANWKGTAIIR